MESTNQRSVDDYVARRLAIVALGFNLIAFILMLDHESARVAIIDGRSHSGENTPN
jgi:hypothetical protein